MTKVIIIRGNSGSGKSSLAKELQNRIGFQTLLISQDTIRREMLYDKPDNKTVELIDYLIRYGLENCDYMIIEGILKEHRYGDMLRKHFAGKKNVFTYYYDISFEETLRRHKNKENAEFGKEEMSNWFVAHDYLGLENEKIIKEHISLNDMVEKVLEDINFKE